MSLVNGRLDLNGRKTIRRGGLTGASRSLALAGRDALYERQWASLRVLGSATLAFRSAAPRAEAVLPPFASVALRREPGVFALELDIFSFGDCKLGMVLMTVFRRPP